MSLRPLLLFLPALFLLKSAPAFAFPVTVNELCESIHSEREESGRSDNRHEFGLFTKLGVKFFPQRYIGVRSNNAAPRPVSETIVFTMRPEVEVIPDASTIRESEKENYRRSKGIQKMVKALVKTRNEESCLDKAARIGITDDHLLEYAEILETSAENQELFMARNFLDFAQESAEVFENSRVVGVSNFEEIIQIVSELPGRDYNFVFVFHADGNGRLLDHDRYVVEGFFFRAIKNKASSISLFSCYPEQVADYYFRNLKRLEESGVVVFQPKLKKIFKEINSTPLGLLEEFAKQVKKRIETP